MKTRLIHCTGYYALINIIASLQMIAKADHEEYSQYKNILLFTYNSLNENDVKHIISLINDNIFKFDEIYYLSKEEIENKSFDTLHTIRANFPTVDEFWDDGHFYLRHVCRDYSYQYEYFINYIKLIIYDEGTGSYLHLFNNEIIADSVYYLLPEILSPMDRLKYPIKEINLDIYKQNLNQINQVLNVQKEQIEENSILFISSLFWERELENIKISYEIKLINTLINDYGYNVCYKSHPRSAFNDLNQVLEGIDNKGKFHIIDFAYNIEIYLANHNFKAILSYYSTVLFSAFKTFGIPTFTYTHEDLIVGREGNFALKTFINLYIPNIKDYLNNQNNYTLEEYYNKFQQNVQQQLLYNSFFEMIKEKQILFMVQERISFLENKNNEIIAEAQRTKELLLGKVDELQNNIIEHKDNFTSYQNTRLAKRLQKIGINSLVAFIPKRALRMEIREKFLQKIYTR